LRAEYRKYIYIFVKSLSTINNVNKFGIWTTGNNMLAKYACVSDAMMFCHAHGMDHVMTAQK
jgi:hypothetical protein